MNERLHQDGHHLFLLNQALKVSFPPHTSQKPIIPTMRKLHFLFLSFFFNLSVLSHASHSSMKPDTGMASSELTALFDVVSDLLDDPNWPQLHPHPCTDTPWPGIQCELLPSSSLLHVTKLHVGPDVATPPCKPSATLSSTPLLSLPYLKTLSLFSCFLNPTSLSSSLFTNTSSLENLVLISNPGLSGSLPSTISNLGNLRVLSLSQNNLHGLIPRELTYLTRLQQLDLSYNSLTGEIPANLGQGLANIAILDLSHNTLVGAIPSSLGNLKSLQKLDLSANNLSSTIPASLGKLDSLVLLDVSYNLLTGPIPNSLSNLSELQYLLIESNPIGTTIPSFIGELKMLAVLGFSECGFVGSIPESVGRLCNLTAISLDRNRLNGSVPEGLGGLPMLGQLNLSQNQLSGVVGFSEEFVRRIGKRLDLRDNRGLYQNVSHSVHQNAACVVESSRDGLGYSDGLSGRPSLGKGEEGSLSSGGLGCGWMDSLLGVGFFVVLIGF